jgi:diguanylate cyclase (GGDEF)-like protein
LARGGAFGAMDWNTLPNFLAVTALVAVFASLLRKPGSDLRLGLVAWALIVVHFGAVMFDASGRNLAATLVRSLSLDLAGLLFLWAAVSKRITFEGFLGFCSLAVPQLAFIALGVANVQPNGAYLALALAGAIVILPAIVFWRIIHAAPRERLLATLACLLLAIAILVVVRFDSNPWDGADSIFSWLFLGAAVLYWRRYQRATAGVLTLVFGFIAWGLVWPIGDALAAWAPNLHIDAADWNIPKYVVAIGIILTLLEDQMERSTFLALHDELTGLPNRRLFEDHLASALARARRSGTQVALLAIDLDRFKAVNDSFGHRAGDEFLRVVAQRFQRRIRTSDTCARLGGDEFVVIANGIEGYADAERLARDLAATLAEPIRLRSADVFAAASIGIAVFPENGDDAEALRTAADSALYVMKRKNRRGDRLVSDALAPNRPAYRN